MLSVKLMSPVQLSNHWIDIQETRIHALPLEDISTPYFLPVIINVNTVHMLTCDFEFHIFRQ